MEFDKRIYDAVGEAEEELRAQFEKIDKISFENTQRVMDAFFENRVDESCLGGTTGYGYNDKGREVLERVYAQVFGAEAALVRHNIVNGTHALAIGLFGLLRPGDIMLSVTGKPYDTLDEVIGNNQKSGDGSLADFGVEYRQLDLLDDGGIDYAGIEGMLEPRVKVVFIQRSKGYLHRPTLSCEDIARIVKIVRNGGSKAFIVVDNCYGEFTQTVEPTAVGADLAIGSLIKNPGGGMAESGGYLVGSEEAVRLVSYRLTSVGVGGEVGATLGQNRNMYKGFFMAPHITAQAVKTALLCAYLFEKFGFRAYPSYKEERYDIIQTVDLFSEEALCAFCRGIQKGSPIDSYVTPEPWEMPGYSDKVIMAAGAFTQGSSIELSADGPIRPPYTAFMQGGLTYESGKLGIMCALAETLKQKEGF